MPPEEIHDSLSTIALQLKILTGQQKEQGKKIDSIQERVSQLPCREHVFRFKGMDTLKNVVIGSILGAVVILVTAGIAWGDLSRSVADHHSKYKYMLEHCCENKCQVPSLFKGVTG